VWLTQIRISSGSSDIRLNGISLERLQDRRKLLRALDGCRRQVETSLALQAQDSAAEAAFDMLSSSKMADALDVSKESPKVRHLTTRSTSSKHAGTLGGTIDA